MNIHYKSVEVWPDDHLIVVRYWTDIITEQFLASSDQQLEDGSPARCRSDVSLSIPIPAPDAEELDLLMFRNAPVHFLQTLENVQNPDVDTSMSSILALKGKKVTKEKIEDIGDNTATASAPTKELTEEEIQKLIESVMSK